MAIELETLEINIEASANGAAKALDELSDSLKKTGKNLDGLNGKEKTVQNVEKNAKQAASAVSNAEQATKKLDQSHGKASSSAKKFNFNLADITKSAGKVQSGISGIFSGLKSGNINSVISGVTSLKSAFGALNKENKKITQTLGGGGIFAPKMAFPIEELKGYLKEYKDAGVTAPKWLKDLTVSNIEGNQAEKSKALASYMDQVGDAAKKAGEGMKQAGVDAGDAGEVAGASAAGWQGVVAVLGIKVVEAVGKVVIGFEKLKASLVLAPFKALGQRIGQTVGKLGQLFSSLKRIATYRLLRTFLKEITEGFSLGVENAYYFSSVTGGTLAKSLDLIATEFLYLKNSIGAAVAPLINALAPAVEFVVDKFVGLVNIVNQFLSAMGLSTKWIKAVKYPTKYKDALDDATGSAKELKRTILGIDEINPLDDNSDKGKSSNKWDASDYSQMFTYETVAPEIGNFAQGLRDKIEHGDWAGVGSLLAEKVNGLVKKADEKIKWENGLGAKITTWLGNIMTAFNSFLTDFDAKNFGTLIGDAIMTAFNTIDTLVQLTDEKTISDKITQFLNGAFEAIDGKKIGKTLHDLLSKVFTIITNVATGVDKTAIGEDVAGFFEGLNLTDLLKKFKGAFKAVGDLIGPEITKALKGVGKSILTALWDDLTTTDPEGVPGWAKAMRVLLGIGQIICGNIVGGLVLVFGGDLFKEIARGIQALGALLEYEFKKLWNGVATILIVAASKSPLTQFIADGLSKTLYDLGDTKIGKAATKTKDLLGQMQDMLYNTGFVNGDKYSNGFETGLTADKKGQENAGAKIQTNVNNGLKPIGSGTSAATKFASRFTQNLTSNKGGLVNAGKIFESYVHSGVNPDGSGKKDATGYRKSYSNDIGKYGINGKDGASFSRKVSNSVKPGQKGNNDGTSYRQGFGFNVGNFGIKVTDGNKFGVRVTGAIDPGDKGADGGKKYRQGFGKNVGQYGINAKDGTSFSGKVSNAVNPWQEGEAGGTKYRQGFGNNLGKYGLKLDSGESFRGKVTAAVNPDKGGKDDNQKYRQAFGIALSYGLNQQAAKKFAETVTSATNPTSAGTTDNQAYRKAFGIALESGLNINDAKKFASAVTAAVKPGTLGTDDNKAYRKAYGASFSYGINGNDAKAFSTGISGAVKSTWQGANGTNLDASAYRKSYGNTMAIGVGNTGKSFGESIGKNINSGIKAGMKKHPVKISLNLPNYTTGGGGKFSATMAVSAAGGVYDSGQLILAQEAGPELVGNIGRKTAVANTSQMVDAMATGVYQANAESNMLLRQIIQYAAEIAAKEYSGGGDVTVESITSAMTRNNRRLGKTVVSVG